MNISFIILTYNRSDALLAVLRSLAGQCVDGHEIVIADDGSRREHVEALVAGLPPCACPIQHVWHPDVGFTAARARNLGVAMSRGDYLVFLDGDCVPDRDFVQRHTQLAARGMFVNGSRVLCSERLSRRVLQQEVHPESVSAVFWLGARLRGDINKLSHLLRLPDGDWRLDRGFRWKGIRSCNFGVWRDDYLAVNGFDESFVGWGHEDADLVLRLHHLGRSRKNGSCATEVFHLWHQENSRGQESSNRQMVSQRIDSNIVRAARGIDEIGHDSGVVVTRLPQKF